MFALQTGFFIGIVVLAFIMQVVPFLLVMTMLSMAFGVSSGVILVVIPTAALAMLVTACWFAETRRRKWHRPKSHLSPHDQRQDRRVAKDQAVAALYQRMLSSIGRRNF